MTKDDLLYALTKNEIALQSLSNDLKLSKEEIKNLILKTNQKAILFVDGGSRGNPGPAGAGFVLNYNSQTIGYYYFIGETTNNVAEYTALLYGLTQCCQENIAELTVYTDSELMCRQINGEYKIKNEKLQELYNKCQKYINGLISFTITHIPREKNKLADKMVNNALDLQKNGIMKMER